MDDQRGISNSLNYLGDVALMQGDVTTARALYDECLALCKKIDEKTSMAHALLGLGLAASPNLPEARESIVYSLRLRVEMGGQVSQISSLIGMAGWAMSDSNPTKAAQLLGGVESALKALKVVMEPTLKNLHTQTLAAVKAALGAAAFQSAWEAGAGWSLEEAVAYALEDSGHDG